MKLSKRGEYALRALIDLGIAAELGRPLLQVSELAAKEKLPVKFLEQIFTQLKANGFVVSKRGRPSLSRESWSSTRWSGNATGGAARRLATASRTRDGVPGRWVRFSSERSARSSLLAIASHILPTYG